MTQLDAYIRVSDVRGRSGDSFISPDEQRERIEHWAKAHGHSITETWEELDVSGGTVNRPKLNEIMRRIEAGESEGVVVAYLSRFGRTLVGTLDLIRRIQDAGGLFASVADDFNITTPNGRLVLNMMLSIAQFELERMGAQWASARERAIGRGVHIGHTPFGYRRANGSGPHGSGALVPDPDEAPFVTEMFRRRAAGHSLVRLSSWLKAEGPDSRNWSNTAVMRILRRPTYLGRAYHGEYSREDAHDALIDRATWQAVQSTRPPRERGPARDSALLLGRARCASCRYAMSVTSPTSTSYKPRGPYYVCANVNCTKKSSIYLNGRQVQGLDDYVVEQVLSDERIQKIEVESHAVNADLDRLDEKVRVANADLTAYVSDREIEKAAGREAYLAGLAERRSAAEAAQAELEDLLRREGGRSQPVTHLRDHWDAMSMDDRREVLGQLIEAVFVRRRELPPDAVPLSRLSGKKREAERKRRTPIGASAERIHIVWAGDPEVDVPRPGRRGFVPRPFVFPDAD